MWFASSKWIITNKIYFKPTNSVRLRSSSQLSIITFFDFKLICVILQNLICNVNLLFVWWYPELQNQNEHASRKLWVNLNYRMGCRDGSDSILIKVKFRWSMDRFPEGAKHSFFSSMSRPPMKLTQPPSQQVPEDFSSSLNLTTDVHWVLKLKSVDFYHHFLKVFMAWTEKYLTPSFHTV
jgi:hypothetical protein